jgi:hypothetical protein
MTAIVLLNVIGATLIVTAIVSALAWAIARDRPLAPRRRILALRVRTPQVQRQNSRPRLRAGRA